MGYDISFHPISEEQIGKWYFEVLENPSLAEQIGIEHKIDEFYIKKYKENIEISLTSDITKSFDATHAYYIAAIQGYFGQFFYARGAAFSFIESTYLDKYYKNWEEFIPNKYTKQTILNEIQSNYFGGKFIPHDQVCQLLKDYKEDEKVKNTMDGQFSFGRIAVILKALEFAKQQKVGILEADGIMEPNPLDLNESTCYSNLFNCDIEGPLLFQEGVLQQIKDEDEDKS